MQIEGGGKQDVETWGVAFPTFLKWGWELVISG